jgi:predicted DsbA family dithiol-disulfide isomerase
MMKVDIWSDIRCPFCYIGKRKFETALAQFPQKNKVEVEWHSFELDPGLKTRPGISVHDYLAQRKGISRETSVQLHNQLTETAGKVGLIYHFDTAVVANSFDAHRLIQLAKLHGLGDAAEERLFKAYYTEGKDISDHLTLIIIGDEIGLNAKAVKQMLDSDELVDEVHHDEELARALGINGVPFYVINDRYGVSGAQAPEVFLQTLEKAWQEYEQENPEAVVAEAETATCSAEGIC